MSDVRISWKAAAFAGSIMLSVGAMVYIVKSVPKLSEESATHSANIAKLESTQESILRDIADIKAMNQTIYSHLLGRSYKR